ncbi:uncharacterized protein LOC131856785 [Cryptomeria japonica]|uniref:uncharacterized protein LOC131856785 n=1 Tax=Cryptomeria japonica TaxID=3369 RepID=UPI0027DA8BBE|nr:uncharacterized protein LOC131856785 [Cryptomeria japonica]
MGVDSGGVTPRNPIFNIGEKIFACVANAIVVHSPRGRLGASALLAAECRRLGGARAGRGRRAGGRRAAGGAQAAGGARAALGGLPPGGCRAAYWRRASVAGSGTQAALRWSGGCFWWQAGGAELVRVVAEVIGVAVFGGEAKGGRRVEPRLPGKARQPENNAGRPGSSGGGSQGPFGGRRGAAGLADAAVGAIRGGADATVRVKD